MIIETCPKCGADLKKYIISTSPPTEAIKCDVCGWYREGAYVFEERGGWSGKERTVRVPFDPEQKSVRVYTDDQYIARDAAREKLCSVCEWEGTNKCEGCENPIDNIPSAVLVSRENLANSRDSHEITNAGRVCSVSDEEPAKEVYIGCAKRNYPDGELDAEMTEAEENAMRLKCWLAWIESPAEKDGTRAAEYIERGKVEKAIAKAFIRRGSAKQYEAAKELIAKIPAADVCPHYRPNQHDRGDDSLCDRFVCEVKALPRWISVTERLPGKDGWYQVYAPYYSGGSSSGLKNINGNMYSAFKHGKWSVEVGYHKRPGCVKAWMPLPEPPKEE